MQTLNPMSMALCGQSLIEASAGTGKTYTITGLYLRYLLGLQKATDEDEQLNTPLSVEQILVVTFTEAATQEIKDRVRARIINARDALLGKKPDDELIEQVIDEVTDKHAAFDLLDAAAKSMDEAAIFTIHGFCQRMLKQHAFESGVAFNLEFILDERELIQETLNDFWRAFVYPQSKERTQAITDIFPVPASLYSQVVSLLNKQGATITPEYDLDDIWQARDNFVAKVPAFKKACLESEFINAVKASDLSGSKTPGRKNSLAALEEYLNNDELFFVFGTNKYSFEVWSTENLSDPANYKKNGNLLSHEMVAQFGEMAKLSSLINNGLNIAIVQYAAKWVANALVKRKQEQGVITPDDLLSNLHQALLSEQGQALSEKIAALFPVAMIDEFQDTDPIQYGIFSRIYGIKNTTLAMIGDPKQAIYGFRGADIFTYIGAKEAVAKDKQYTLDTNYRSSEGVVDSVNRLFAKNDNSFIYNDAIPFQKVNAKGKQQDKAFLINGEMPSAFEFSVFVDEYAEANNKPTSKGVAQQALALQYTKKITDLLKQADAGYATIAGKPLTAADICVLVRDRNEAQLMKTALAEAAIASVYLSRDSVFNQELSHHLLNFLTALHGQYDESLLRGVLAGPLFCLSYNRIYELHENESAWQEHLNFFAQLAHIWHKQGAMAMLERLLSHNQLAARWQGLGYNVERWLTDFRHLGEILQQKQIELEGTHRLLRWFAQKVSQQDGEAVQVRLESDANLVKIVTMHASKGLEYPIVFMPFACGYRESKEALYHKDGKLIYDLAKSDDAMQKAEQERLAEDLRLLYVALTRAVHFCSVGMYNIALGRSARPGIQSTSIGHVLFAGLEIKSGDEWRALLQQFCEGSAHMHYEAFSQADELEKLTFAGAANEQEYQVNTVKADIQRDWRSTSFSSLTLKKHTDHIELGRSDEDHEKDEFLAQNANALTPYSFPKGAKPGSCLHEIFEQLDFTDPYALKRPASEQEDHALDKVIKTLFEKYHIDDSWQEMSEQWILAALNCPLNDKGLSLSVLEPDTCLVEMEFNLPLLSLSSDRLNQVLVKHFNLPGQLDFSEVQGLLKGFIDLIFCWQGKYYILDYKSNFLGNSAADYQHEQLEQAMTSHQYHLQYLIYTVALHRLLKQRIQDYDSDTHLGGVYYTFLRGMSEGQGVYFNQLTKQQITELDSLFAQGAML
ncbi:exodeoxyribonuclease V subunit beta [Pseudoalteromonas arabiensis]|uniref:exodeoxyribonuclease V subunit beta n=1 Tax=Pseudoalteromonas arabiensis TaxID=874454 RepID=UPI0007851A88|nr:exodeoxyribonuclease V subunit beta [Pseudoalteromonas arabiensis]